MRRAALLAISCLALVAVPCSSQENDPGQEPAPGRIADNMVCRGDAGQRYAVFLPSAYSRDRARDEALIERIAARATSEARAEEDAGRFYGAWSRYSTLAATLARFRDVGPYEQKAREFAASGEVQRALHEQAGSIRLQQAAHARLTRLALEVLADDDRVAAAARFLQAFDALRQQSNRPADDAERMAARRVIVSSWSNLNAAAADMAAGAAGFRSARGFRGGQSTGASPDWFSQ